MFLEVYKNCFDSSKPNYLFITKDYLNGNRKVQFGQNYYILRALKEKYNVFILDFGVSSTFNKQFIEDKENNYVIFDGTKYSQLTDTLKRKREDGTAFEYNFDTFMESYRESFKDIKFDKIYVQAHSYSVLSPVSYGPGFRNDFFDYVGNDREHMKKIEIAAQETWKNLFGNKLSPLAFLLYGKYVFYTLMYYFAKETSVCECNVVTCDPTIIWPQFFDFIGMNTNFYYFVDDTRGTRRFKKFPLLQLRTLAGTQGKKPLLLDEKEFFYSGSILNDRSDYIRKIYWERYLKNLDLNPDKNSIYTFLKYNSDSFKKNEVKGNIEKLEEYNLLQLYDEIKEHKLFKGSYENNMEYSIAREYNYFLCLTPLTPYDSVNVRPGYCYVDTLPLFSVEYDPDNLYEIPMEIKKELVVRNSSDIQSKIKYFNENKKERHALNAALCQHFNFDHIKNNYSKVINDLL